MKTNWTILFFFLALTVIRSQRTPVVNFKPSAPSPEASVKQQFGKNQISISYARPLARGRKIFGDLIPFDTLWRTGASDCTTIRFTEEVIFGDKKIMPGKYALFTIPAKEEWTIILNADTTLHGAFGYDPSQDIHRIKVKPENSDRFYETFTIEINDISAQGNANLNLIWENTWVSVPLKNPVDEAIMTEIRDRIIEKGEPNADLLFQAASYYYGTARDLRLAAEWINTAEKLEDENFEYPNLAQKILGDLKEYPLAIKAAQRAILIGEKKKMNSAVDNLKKRIILLESLMRIQQQEKK